MSKHIILRPELAIISNNTYQLFIWIIWKNVPALFEANTELSRFSEPKKTSVFTKSNISLFRLFFTKLKK